MFTLSINKFSFYFILSVIFISCANPRPPSGGPPDKTPPKVIEFSPLNRSLNFQGNKIYIEFNKWVDRNSVINNIFLNPPLRYKVDWSGKKMYVHFAEPLPNETTISFLLGTNYMDLDGNQPTEPFNLVFSTGTKIDSGSIYGKVIADGLQNIFVYAIPTSELYDTSFDINTSFHYRTQPDNQGNFKLEALKSSSYLIFSFNDKNKNKVFDYGIEDFGFASDTITLYGSLPDSVIIINNPPIDEVRPFVVNAYEIDQNIVKLSFSEQVEVSKDAIFNSIRFFDTLKSRFFTPFSGQVDINKPNELLLFFKDKLPEGIYQIIVSNPDNIKDTAGNPVSTDIKQIIRITQSEFNLPLEIFEKIVQLKTPIDTLLITFNKPLDSAISKFIVKAINLSRKDTLDADCSLLELNKLHIKIPNLKWKDNYKVLIYSNLICDFSGKMYSNKSFELTIKVEDEPSLGSIRGILLTRIDNAFGQPMVMLYSPLKKYYSKVLNNNWKFENVLEGEYQLIAFYDRNNNEIYDSGRYKPLQLSEKLIKQPIRVSVKKGWSIEEIRF